MAWKLQTRRLANFKVSDDIMMTPSSETLRHLESMEWNAGIKLQNRDPKTALAIVGVVKYHAQNCRMDVVTEAFVTRSEKSWLPRTQQQDTLFTIKQ